MENNSDKKDVIAERKRMFDSGLLQKELFKGLVGESTWDAIKAFKNSPTMEAIQAMQETPMMRALQAFHDTPMMKALNAAQNTPAMRLMAAVQRMTSMQLADLVPLPSLDEHWKKMHSLGYSLDGFREAAQALEATQSSPLAEFFASDNSADVPDLVEASGDARVSFDASLDIRVATQHELELERQIVQHLEQGKPAKALSSEQKSRLTVIMFCIWLIMTLLEKEATIRQELCFFQPKLAPGLTSGQVGKAVRNFMCEREVPAELVLKIRSVKGTGVKLRAGPGMKAEVLPVNLQDRELLEVLDTDNPDWLHVSVIGDRGVEGWISRKYTHRSTR